MERHGASLPRHLDRSAEAPLPRHVILSGDRSPESKDPRGSRCNRERVHRVPAATVAGGSPVEAGYGLAALAGILRLRLLTLTPLRMT